MEKLSFNNFDQSSSGVSITLDCFLDNDISRFYFDENFTKYNGNYWLYTDCGALNENDLDVSLIENYSDLIKHIKAALLTQFSLDELREVSLREIGVQFNRLKRADFNLLLSALFYNDNERIEFMLTYLTPKTFEIITTCGYSQGDYAKVVVSNDVKFNDISTHIDHLFWDSPLHCVLTVADDEFNFLDFIDDVYSYDKEKLIFIFNQYYAGDHKSEALCFLRDNLPDHPGYCD